VQACLNRASALLESERSRAAYQFAVAQSREPSPMLSPWQTQRVTTYISANVARPIRLVELTRLTRMRATQFVCAFRATFGMEVHDFITLRRLNLACIVMLTTDQTLGQIAEDCGLCDEVQFSAAFQDVFGELPAAWRRSRRGLVGRGLARPAADS
jgi:AraC-like DNA-binding protein